MLSGEPRGRKLKEIKFNFHHFTNAMHNPQENIYQSLDLDIPDEPVVKRHSSGLYDDQFITFQLPQIVMENQQSSLVCTSCTSPFHPLQHLIVDNGSISNLSIKGEQKYIGSG